MPKKSQKELIQISFMIFLIVGLLLSLGLLIWLSLPDSTKKASQSRKVDELDESEYSNLVKGPMHLKLKGNFQKIPKSNKKVLFESQNGFVQLCIPSDFPNDFQMSSIEVDVHYLGTYNKIREFQLLGFKTLDSDIVDSWTSQVRPKPRLRSSSWYYF